MLPVIGLLILLTTQVARAAPPANVRTAVRVSKQVFGPRWRLAACISWYESRDELAAVNGPNLGPWQINVQAHPWVNSVRLRRSWLYSARVAYRISAHGTDWSAWTTAGLCVHSG